MQVIIMAFGKARPIFDQHLPFWRAHGWPITVFSPTDDPVDCPDTDCIHYGLSSHSGVKAYGRLLEVLRYIVRTAIDFSYIFEYDSICLNRVLPEVQGLHGCIHATESFQRWISPRYVMVPWILDCPSARRMLWVAEEYPDVKEEGFHDRLISAWAFLAGVPILPHSDPFASENTILPPYENVHNLNQARWIHGIKDQACLTYIRSLWKL